MNGTVKFTHVPHLKQKWVADHPDLLAGVLSPGTPEQEVLRACQLLMRPGEVHELRIPKAGRERTISGYFESPERMPKLFRSMTENIPEST